MNYENNKMLSSIRKLIANGLRSDREFDYVLGHILEIIRYQFDAYLIDVVLESNVDDKVELIPIKMLETEDHNFKGVFVGPFKDDKDDDKRSLMAWCYRNNEEVWIVDEDGIGNNLTVDVGIRPENPTNYHNYMESPRKSLNGIPKSEIYKYNRAAIRTEICWPLRLKIEGHRYTVVGVLNIEMEKALLPTKQSLSFIKEAVQVILMVITQRIAARGGDELFLSELCSVKEQAFKHKYRMAREPNLHIKAFLAWPFALGVSADSSDKGSEQPRAVFNMVKKILKKYNIEINEIDTTNRISENIFRSIDSSHFGVVIYWKNNLNVFLEWGYMLGKGMPVIVIFVPSGGMKKPDDEAPFDVKDIFMFTTKEETENKVDEESLRCQLEKGLEQLKKDNPNLFPSPMRNNFQSTSPGNSSEEPKHTI